MLMALAKMFCSNPNSISRFRITKIKLLCHHSTEFTLTFLDIKFIISMLHFRSISCNLCLYKSQNNASCLIILYDSYVRIWWVIVERWWFSWHEIYRQYTIDGYKFPISRASFSSSFWFSGSSCAIGERGTQDRGIHRVFRPIQCAESRRLHKQELWKSSTTLALV